MSSVANLSGFSEIDLVALLQQMVKGDTATNIAGHSQQVLSMMTMMHAMQKASNPENDVEALNAIRRGRIDYFRSRAIKTELRADPAVDGWLYDRDTQVGSFVRIANRVRAERNIPLVH